MFGEGGGKGASINSFLKSLSRTNTGKQSTGSGHSSKSVIADDPKVIGASFSHLNRSSSQPKKTHSTANHTNKPHHGQKPKKQHPFQKNIYMDSDDDWDADVDRSISDSNHNSLELPSSRSELKLFPAAQITPSVSQVGLEKPPNLVQLTLQRGSGSSEANSDSSSVEEDNTGATILRKNYGQIIEDPVYILQVFQGPNVSRYDENLIGTSGAREELSASIARFNRFKKVLLERPNINLEELKKLSWNGVPNELKAVIWQLLLGYLSTSSDRRISALQRKRKEYADQIADVMLDEKDTITWHQITIDIPRTNPHIKLYSYPVIQRSLERVLYLWAVRHPASGYVQGINDICTPFFQVFLAAYLDNGKENCVDIGDVDPSEIPESVLDIVEADTYWCLTKLLDSIQDNYIHAQPGIIRQVNDLKDLTNRIDSDLVKHLETEGIEFLQFSFRWMNCLLMRELNMNHIIRMWDTYLTEGSNGFSEFHIYVCAAFLVKWLDRIKEMDFQEIMIFLQSLPTRNWDNKDIELLLSEAYMWQTLYKNASAHLR